MKPSNRQRCLAGLMLGAWMVHALPLEAIELPWSRRTYQYSLYIPQNARHEVSLGDYVEIGVVSGPEGHRQRKAVARKAQVVRISESVRSNVGISITMTRKDIEVMNRMMTEPSARVYVRVVQKNNRPEPYAGATSDGIPELDLESDDLLIRNTATLAASPKPE